MPAIIGTILSSVIVELTEFFRRSPRIFVRLHYFDSSVVLQLIQAQGKAQK